jgi:putative transposase
MKSSPEYAWLKEADSQAQQEALKDLDQAYQNFFAGRARYPHFKSKRGKQRVSYPQRVKADHKGRRTYLPKVGWVKTVFHRPMEGKVKKVVVSKTKSGRYYASFQVEEEIPEPVCQGEAVGIDLGLAHYAVLSDGMKIPNPHNLIGSQKKLARLQRQLSRRERGSGGWEKARLQVARLQERIADQRRDFQHKVTRWLVEEFRVIGLESLNVKGMLGNGRLAKQIADASWGEFIRQLGYKGEWYGCRIVKDDPWYPSSKTCSECGAVMEEMPLQIGKWRCPRCQTQHDRDVNAARNILDQAAVATTESHAGGVQVRPVVHRTQAGTQKPEAQQLAAG